MSEKLTYSRHEIRVLAEMLVFEIQKDYDSILTSHSFNHGYRQGLSDLLDILKDGEGK